LEKNEIISIGLKKKTGELDISWEQIGVMCNVPGETVRQWVKAHQKQQGTLKGKYEEGREKMLIFSDLHIPDHQEKMILSIVEKNKNVDTIVLAGDILDCHAVSAWMNEEITILDHEMIMAHELLKKIRAITKAKIIFVKGNHEQRVNNHYAKNAKAMGTAVVETEVLYKLAKGFEVKRKVGKNFVREEFPAIRNVEYCEARSFFYGDLLINHPTIFSKDNMKTVKRMWEEKLKNKYPSAKVVIIGHTHQLGMVYYEDGRVLIEDGCTCYPASYADQDDRPFKMQQYGYVYLEMKDKKVDLDTIQVISLGHDNFDEIEDIADDSY
jgi:predicted phosphodiesterase